MKKHPLSLCCLLVFGLSLMLQAHTIPSLNLEVEIASGKSTRLLLNIDPRLFMSTTPAQLPPVTADWYRGLTPEAKQGAEKAASDFIGKSLTFVTDEGALTPTWSYVAIDGSDNTPLKETTTELHMLAEATLPLPSTAKSFYLKLSPQSPAALTMLSMIDGKASRRPQVLFPGEESRPLTWADALVPAPAPPPQPPAMVPIPSAPEAVAAETTPWYQAPFFLGWSKVMSLQGWPSLVFVICLLLMRRGFTAALVALMLFHLAHLLASYLCGWRMWVLPMLDYAWPVSCLALLLVGKRPMLMVIVMSALALMHVLDEWPTAMTPGVALMTEIGFGLATVVLLICVYAVSRLIKKLRGQKRGGRGDRLSLGGMWKS